jgi:molybdopterin-guanine dinucleotide biosynthesis protein A
MDELFHPAPPVAAVILAGGGASRMGGGDKGRQLIGGLSILERLIERLRPQVSALAINANGDADRFASTGLPVLADEAGADGPLAGLLAGLDWAAGAGFPWLLSTPTDTPFLPPDLMMRLAMGLRGGAKAVIAGSAGWRHPVIGLWRTSLAESLRRFLAVGGERRTRLWAEDCAAATVNWPEQDIDPFFNVNTPQDRGEAEALLGSPLRQAGAVVLPSGLDAYGLFEDLVAEARRRKIRIGGLLQQGSTSLGTPSAEVMMLDLASGERYPIMQQLGKGGSCAADTQAIASASVALRRAIDQRCELIMVNKFGSLEAEGGGLADEMMVAMAEGLPLLTTVSTGRLNTWLDFCGGCCELLPADTKSLRRWLDRQCLASS